MALTPELHGEGLIRLLREARAATPVEVLFDGEEPTPNGDSGLPGLEAPWTGSPSELLRLPP